MLANWFRAMRRIEHPHVEPVMRSILLSLVMLAVPAQAGARTLRVVNDTSAAVNQLFVSGEETGKLRAKVSGIFGAPDGERDRLEAKLLPRGGSIAVELRGERCRYDIRAVLEDGRTFAAEDVDVCADGRWAISSGSRR